MLLRLWNEDVSVLIDWSGGSAHSSGPQNWGSTGSVVHTDLEAVQNWADGIEYRRESTACKQQPDRASIRLCHHERPGITTGAKPREPVGCLDLNTVLKSSQPDSTVVDYRFDIQ